MFLRKGVLKICSKFAGEHPCQSVFSIKLQSNFIEIELRDGCSPANLRHIFRTPFLKNTSGRLLLIFVFYSLCLLTFTKTFFSNHYCQIFQELRPSQVFYLNDLLVSLPEKGRTIFKSLIRTLLCSKVNMRNHRLLYVSC